MAEVVAHIDHIRDRIGVDYIGIGSDFDGMSGAPTGLEDVGSYPNLFAELLRRGYSEEELRKITGLNVLRVMRKAEQVATKLRGIRPPSETLFQPEAQ